MDRPHRGPVGPARASGAPVTADFPAVAAAPGTAKTLEARNLFLSFGSTPRSAGVLPNERNRFRASRVFAVPGAAATAGKSAVTGAPLARAGPTGPRCGRSISGQPPVGRARGRRGARRVDRSPA